jgi:hypothetical protein
MQKRKKARKLQNCDRIDPKEVIIMHEMTIEELETRLKAEEGLAALVSYL